MAIVVRQLGNPHGILGRFVGRRMARGHAAFNRWLVEQLQEWARESAVVVERVAELGPGPGVGLEQALRAFPAARVWGIEPSQAMLDLSRSRNLEQVNSGRLVLIEGDSSALADLAPLDLVFAVHVLYFWHQPRQELARVHAALRPGGALALGYELAQHWPRTFRAGFRKEGHRLYESDQEVSSVLREAGFGSVDCRLLDDNLGAASGRVAIALA